MASRMPRVTLGSEWLRRRLFWTAAFVLVAVAGAGLASAVDRPHTQQDRPELGFTADSRAEPWLAGMLAELDRLEPEVVALATAGRRLFIDISGLELDDIDAGVATGDEVSRRLADAIAPLLALRAELPAGVQPWRLGDVRREQLSRIDSAIASIATLETVWQAMTADAARAVELVTALERHDELALAALAAGRSASWSEAADLLEDAGPALEEAADARDALAPETPSRLLDDLLTRHNDHDLALLALYRHLAESGSLEDPEGIELRQQVERARTALPTPPETLRAVVAETAGRSLSQHLAAIEEARGSISEALDEGDDDPPEGDEETQ